VDAAIRKALEKLPADRFTRAADFAGALSDPGFRHGMDERAVAAGDSKRWRMATIAATVVAVLAVGAGMAGMLGSGPADAPVVRQKIEVSTMGAVFRWGRDVALAPDGSGMAYPDQVSPESPPQLFYKARNEAEGTPLPGTENYNGVVFSPDGEQVVYMQRGSLITRPIRGGAATTLASLTDLGTPGLDWMNDGSILYEGRAGVRLLRMWPDGRAQPDSLLQQGNGLRWAKAISGTETVLVNNCPGCDLGIMDLRTKEVTWVLEGVARAWYVPTGHIVWVRSDGAVFAQPYDTETRELGAVGVSLFEGVRTGQGWADMVVGDDGTMAYVTGQGFGGAGGDDRLVWFDRSGTATPVDASWVGELGEDPRLSPDGTRIAVSVTGADGGVDVWVHQLADGTRTRLTPGDGEYRYPTWTEDSRSLVMLALGDDTRVRLIRLRADGSDPAAEELLGWDLSIRAVSLVPGGTGIVFEGTGGVNGTPDLYYHDFAGDSTSTLWGTEFNEYAPTVSPDGRWLAYMQIVDGTFEVFVRPFPNVSDSRTQISSGGGASPAWSRDGTELFYQARGENNVPEGLVSVRFTADSDFVVTERTPLFDLGTGFAADFRGRAYDVDASGGRFLAVAVSEEASRGDNTDADIVLVQNWFTELRARLGGN
jgi:serine/threonine-protein kinase